MYSKKIIFATFLINWELCQENFLHLRNVHNIFSSLILQNFSPTPMNILLIKKGNMFRTIECYCHPWQPTKWIDSVICNDESFIHYKIDSISFIIFCADSLFIKNSLLNIFITYSVKKGNFIFIDIYCE